MSHPPRTLFVIDSLAPSGRARQVVYLAAELQRMGWPMGVAALGKDDNRIWWDDLKAAGVWLFGPQGWRQPFDLRSLNPFNDFQIQLGKGAPSVIHSWGLSTAFTLALTACRPSRLTVSSALPAPDSWQWPARLLLRRVKRVVAIGDAEAEAYRRLGVPADRLAVVPPGVPVPDALPAPATLPGLPDDARVVLCLGPSQRHKGHRDAAWGIDVLHLLDDRVRLVILGAGPELDVVRRLKRTNDLAHVHLPGVVPDVLPWLARAEVVWVPSLRDGGRYAALEAMAAGRPVVASRLPGLAELVEDGKSGHLFTPGDKPDLCRKTRLLLDDPDQARATGDAARRRVAERFSLRAHAAAMAEWLAQ